MIALNLLPQLNLYNGILAVLITSGLFVIGFFLYYPYEQNFYESYHNKPHAKEDKKLKVVNTYFGGLFKKSIIIDLNKKIFKYSILLSNGKYFVFFAYQKAIR